MSGTTLHSPDGAQRLQENVPDAKAREKLALLEPRRPDSPVHSAETEG